MSAEPVDPEASLPALAPYVEFSAELPGYGTPRFRFYTEHWKKSSSPEQILNARVSDALMHEDGWMQVERFSPSGNFDGDDWHPSRINLKHFAIIDRITT